jgi:hypothetical protein
MQVAFTDSILRSKVRAFRNLREVLNLIRLNIFRIKHLIRSRIWNLLRLTDDRSGFLSSLQAEYYNPRIRFTVDADISLDNFFLEKFKLCYINCVGVLLLKCRIDTLYLFNLSTFVNYKIRDITFRNPINYKLTFSECKHFCSKNFRLVGGIDANEISWDFFSYSFCNPGIHRVPIRSIQVL